LNFENELPSLLGLPTAESREQMPPKNKFQVRLLIKRMSSQASQASQQQKAERAESGEQRAASWPPKDNFQASLVLITRMSSQAPLAPQQQRAESRGQRAESREQLRASKKQNPS
jgi:hypothetical protein